VRLAQSAGSLPDALEVRDDPDQAVEEVERRHGRQRPARGLDEEARRLSFESFAEAPVEAQTGIVHRFSQAELHGGVWDTVNVGRAWKVVMRYVVQAYYSHPWAWNEIGFGGPAYPRGYGAFGSPDLGEKDSWETDEQVHVDPVPDVRERELD